MKSFLNRLFGRTSRKSSARRPGLETLEARDCPATISFSNLFGGGVGMFITGNATGDINDNVTVRENHNANTITVTHENTAGQYQTQTWGTANLRYIEANLGNGDDRFRYELDNSDYTDAKVVKVNLGDAATAMRDEARFVLNGDSNPDPNVFTQATIRATAQFQVYGAARGQWAAFDVGTVAADLYLDAFLGADIDEFDVTMTGDVTATGNLSVRAYGQDGADNLAFVGTSDVDIAANRRLYVELDGGNGGDVLSLRYRGELDGRLQMTLRGGADGDNISAVVTKDAGSTGYNDGFLSGDAGNDLLSFAGDVAFMLIDGGADSDTVTINGVTTNG